jgi:hypothetical protein
VRPPNYNEILVDVRHSHKPVILEGQSGTGKTSCVRHILAELDPGKKAEYLTARDPFHVLTIEKVVTAHSPGSYVIDDFHRLTVDLQEQIADVAKLSADLQRPDLPKLIIIGINQVGTQLIQLVPDIAKRTGIHRISPGRRQDIDKLIQSGCERLNIKIKGAEDIYTRIPRMTHCVEQLSRRFRYRCQCLISSDRGNSWHTRRVNRNRMLFGSISTAA